MKKLITILIASLVMTALSPAAQKKKDDDTPTRSVQGVVTDQTDSLVEGAVVQLKDRKTLQIRSFITKQNGSYYFHNLSPEIDYELKAESKGSSSQTRTLSSFDSRKKAIMNLKIGDRP